MGLFALAEESIPNPIETFPVLDLMANHGNDEGSFYISRIHPLPIHLRLPPFRAPRFMLFISCVSRAVLIVGSRRNTCATLLPTFTISLFFTNYGLSILEAKRRSYCRCDQHERSSG
ncbi:hypothetical protein M408DRAFT_121249 [Serendipita vermifera MAFF 305830]|uniref:Uncharacterized protein n=1 Tax=Serendipita vermifera MAFF 305830 TaxID=933852 RepID=A0A0C2WSY2_SERVB|nr:hypothetical protein M408DRAFT_121249 [Serendipita vermifera MAFF 305830]